MIYLLELEVYLLELEERQKKARRRRRGIVGGRAPSEAICALGQSEAMSFVKSVVILSAAALAALTISLPSVT